jgi:deoxyribodipyrimidine photo-lyase
MRTALFWFRRDLRLDDNAGLFHALKGPEPVIPIFIFDTHILDELKDKADKRVDFIYREIKRLQEQLLSWGSSLLVYHSTPLEAFKKLLQQYDIACVYTNHDYEPYAVHRDKEVQQLLATKGIALKTYKDQVIFERQEVVKDDGAPYTVFTPYSKKWKSQLQPFYLKPYPTLKYKHNFRKLEATKIPSLASLGFENTGTAFPEPEVNEGLLRTYDQTRDIPAVDGTSKLGLHLRFGTVSIRQLAGIATGLNETFLNELIWREFFMMILWHFPRVINTSFKEEYDRIIWRNKKEEFERWCNGTTGYPIVDAGMRELNATGFMHNRVRMITASFLTKHLLIDWRWGEAYFAQKLLDYDLSANNGNWQWAAGCGCDAAPYFRIFSPQRQTEKFDPQGTYIRKWVPELDAFGYPAPIVDHAAARDRCLATYKKALQR